MKFDILKTRRGKLKAKLENYLLNSLEEIDYVLDAIDEYEKDNLETIEKLRKEKTIDTKRINGALKQSINAHGPVTKLLIGSATKRIYGSLLINSTTKKITIYQKYKQLLFGLLLGIIITSIINLF